jgi:hypothetical protein
MRVKRRQTMARNDLHVLVYRILSYLYQQLKDGTEIDESKIDEHALNIPHSYWIYIFDELQSAKYTKGYTIVNVNGGRKRLEHLDRAVITLRGVEYLTSDQLMIKVKNES